VTVLTATDELPRLAAECDLAIVHADNGLSDRLLAANKPQLLLPLTPATVRAAQRIESLGGGRCANAQSGKDAILKLRALWETRG
jgi:UDP:flavonoid glycosyltransferase YjiC (YdhE family)